MSDITAAPAAATSAIKLPGLGDIGAFFKRGDIALAVGVLTILVVLILPLPPILLDLFLAISIILSVLILMTSLFIHAPLEFSAFPTILLISTMLRLSLNLASTRLILSHGHEGTAAAGHVIEAFVNFVMGGNFVIGIIVFTILVIVKTMMPMTKLPPITKLPNASMTWPAAAVPSWPCDRINRVEARLSDSRNMVEISRIVGNA